MNEIRKVVSTLWYDKDNYHTLRNVFPNAEFVYVDFYDKEKLSEMLLNIASKGDAVLFKGSRGMKLEDVINTVYKGWRKQ